MAEVKNARNVSRMYINFTLQPSRDHVQPTKTNKNQEKDVNQLHTTVSQC